MYDSVGQFYPWRKFASETIRTGYLPLWNPYQFCGTPFVANSQSAVFYPGNLLFYILRPDAAAGWSVILHLTLAAGFMWLFVRALGVSSGAAALAGIAFAFSTWQVSWLHLPTFLTTSCWLPLVLLLLLRLFEHGRWQSAVGLGFVLAMTLLAGHLQIAFYVLLAAGLLSVWLIARGIRARESKRALRFVALTAGSLSLAGALAAPQLLPSMELSRYSHRAGAPTEEGFAAYRNYAVSESTAALALFPDFFGNPSDPGNPYFGASKGDIPFNYSENAAYVGAVTFFLALAALASRGKGDWSKWYLAFLAVLAVLMALGTGISRLLYFTVPGFSSSGSPGRALLLFAFAVSALGGLGYERLLAGERSKRGLVVAAVLFLIVVVGAYAASQGVVGKLGGDSDVLRGYVARQAGMIALSLAAAAALAVGLKRRPWMIALPAVLLVVDLFAAGANYNPTAKPAEVYPLTEEIGTLQRQAGHDRIMPVNERWIPLFRIPGMAAPNVMLPPNGAMVFGLRDIQGYDSLFPAQYKAYLTRALGVDPSPPEVGNMVFVKSANLALARALGARFLLDSSNPSSAIQDLSLVESGISRARMIPAGRVRWLEDRPTRADLEVIVSGEASLRLADQYYPGWTARVDGKPAAISRGDDIFRAVETPAGTHRVVFEYRPMCFRFGLYLMGLALAVGGFTSVWFWPRKGSPRAVPSV